MGWYVLRTDTGIVGHGGLLLGLLTFPGADTFVDVLGEGIILAEAVVVRVVLAFGDGDPGLETLRKDGWCSWGCDWGCDWGCGSNLGHWWC